MGCALAMFIFRLHFPILNSSQGRRQRRPFGQRFMGTRKVRPEQIPFRLLQKQGALCQLLDQIRGWIVEKIVLTLL